MKGPAIRRPLPPRGRILRQGEVCARNPIGLERHGLTWTSMRRPHEHDCVSARRFACGLVEDPVITFAVGYSGPNQRTGRGAEMQLDMLPHNGYLEHSARGNQSADTRILLEAVVVPDRVIGIGWCWRRCSRKVHLEFVFGIFGKHNEASRRPQAVTVTALAITRVIVDAITVLVHLRSLQSIVQMLVDVKVPGAWVGAWNRNVELNRLGLHRTVWTGCAIDAVAEHHTVILKVDVFSNRLQFSAGDEAVIIARLGNNADAVIHVDRLVALRYKRPRYLQLNMHRAPFFARHVDVPVDLARLGRRQLVVRETLRVLREEPVVLLAGQTRVRVECAQRGIGNRDRRRLENEGIRRAGGYTGWSGIVVIHTGGGDDVVLGEGRVRI